MSDLSDPTTLREAAARAHMFSKDRKDSMTFACFNAGWDAAAAHFAAELDGLRAQIEEALRLRNKPGAHKEHVLAAFDESPRGTVARIQAEALDAVAAKCASFEAAEFMRREAATLREAAGQ